MNWFYIDFKVIDHDSEFAAPVETTMINAETKEIAVSRFVSEMEGEPFEMIDVREYVK